MVTKILLWDAGSGKTERVVTAEPAEGADVLCGKEKYDYDT